MNIEKFKVSYSNVAALALRITIATQCALTVFSLYVYSSMAYAYDITESVNFFSVPFLLQYLIITFFILGLFTRITALILLVLDIIAVVPDTLSMLVSGSLGTHIAYVGICTALCLLGPGKYSLDYKIFRRKDKNLDERPIISQGI